jgi:hypothetical protein
MFAVGTRTLKGGWGAAGSSLSLSTSSSATASLTERVTQMRLGAQDGRASLDGRGSLANRRLSPADLSRGVAVANYHRASLDEPRRPSPSLEQPSRASMSAAPGTAYAPRAAAGQRSVRCGEESWGCWTRRVVLITCTCTQPRERAWTTPLRPVCVCVFVCARCATVADHRAWQRWGHARGGGLGGLGGLAQVARPAGAGERNAHRHRLPPLSSAARYGGSARSRPRYAAMVSRSSAGLLGPQRRRGGHRSTAQALAMGRGALSDSAATWTPA